MNIKFIALALIFIGLTGCSLVDGNSEYGCKGMPNSVTCKSATEVYELTDGDDYQQRVNEVSQQQLEGKEGVKQSNDKATPSINQGAPYVPVPQPTANPQPIRTPAQVMRVLVDPYESADGDLNIPGYVYTEIAPRRWEIGASRASTTQPIIRPMQTPVSSEQISEKSSPQNKIKNTKK